MNLSGKALGLEISQHHAHFVLLQGKAKAPRLESGITVEFPPETIGLSMREENVLNQEAFTAQLRAGYLKLLTGIRRVSVSLPDGIGRTMILDLETRFKTREEGIDIIKWKLKKNFPFDVNDLHLDYQVIRERESGELAALVSLIDRKVIGQYEDLLNDAGLQAVKIDFTTFNVCRLFSGRLELVESCLMVVWRHGMINILIFSEGMLDFYRAKDLTGTEGEMNRIYREITSSLKVYRDKHPGFVMAEVFCVTDRKDAETVRAVAAEATGLQPVILDPSRFVSPAAGMSADDLSSAIGAIGAAFRNL